MLRKREEEITSESGACNGSHGFEGETISESGASVHERESHGFEGDGEKMKESIE